MFGAYFLLSLDFRLSVKIETYFNVASSSFGLKSFRWLVPKIWELVPDNVTHAKSLSAFKIALKKLNIDNCPCKLCKDYIHGVGYIN